MELNHLKYFYEVARLGSFTRASKSLRISQPSISKMIKNLEEQQGVRLLDRTQRSGVSLTEPGRIFYQSCQSIFQEVGNLQRSLEYQNKECVGDLLLGVSDNLGNYVMPELLKAFCKAHPKVVVKLFTGTSASINGEILANELELGLFYTQVKEPKLELERLGFVEFVIAYSAKNEVLKPDRFDPELLEQVPYVGCRTKDYEQAYPTLKMLHGLGVRPRIPIQANSQETQKRLAIEDFGFTVIPEFMIRHEVNRNRLKILRTPKKLGSDLYLARKRGKTLSKPALVFESYLRAGLEKFL